MPLPTALFLVPLLGASGEDEVPWPEYRGPGRDGHAPSDADPPLRWSEDENVRWKTAVHGRGWSSPVVGEGRVWLTTADPEGHALSVLCVDLETGEVLLDRVLFEVDEPQERNDLNSYASPSAVLAPGRALVHFGAEGTALLDTRTHAVLWSRTDLRCDHMEGPGSSPALLGDRVVVHVDGGDVQYVAALDLESGETLWRTERSLPLDDLQPDLRKAYSTPLPVRTGGVEAVVSSAARGTWAYALADGRELWRVRHPGFSMSSRPVLAGELVLVNTGFMRPELWAIRLGGEDDATDTHVAWKVQRSVPSMSSPVLVDGRLFLVDDGGIASCLDASTGETLWRERLAGRHCASPLHASGRVYYFDRDGRTTVVAAAEELERLAESRLDAGFMASPAVVGDAFVLRTETHLYRIEE